MFKGWLKGTQEKLEKKSFSAFYHYLVDNHECVSNYKLENFVMHRKKVIYNFISMKFFFVKITTVSTVLYITLLSVCRRYNGKTRKLDR